ncbi:hypothetical protein [Legionella geestiana]|nr:hypothetical protein [Legionella geestiana]
MKKFLLAASLCVSVLLVSGCGCMGSSCSGCCTPPPSNCCGNSDWY